MKDQKSLRQTNYLMLALTVILIGVILCLSIGMSGSPVSDNTEKPFTSLYDASDDMLQIIDFNVGKADAAVIRFKNSIGVIDSGTEASFPTIDSWFEDRGITNIDYLILTHYDKDHIGGAVDLLDKYDVKTVYIPDYVSEKTLYKGLMDKLSEKDGVTTVNSDTSFRIDAVSVEIIPADDPAALITDKDNVDNNMSLLCMVTYGSKKFLFAGDVESDRIEQLLASSHDLDSDWIKIPHHGNYDSKLDELMDVVTPEYAIISTSSDETPSNKLLKLLNKKDVTALDTMNRAVVTDCDGTDIIIE
ncbi:MAG: MBL fold metallo-hydrolase [Lachnospiraceae bacterium]|nr:MBL fold metallo-hydrolase [Lachnospiraceae bacterium]